MVNKYIKRPKKTKDISNLSADELIGRVYSRIVHFVAHKPRTVAEARSKIKDIFDKKYADASEDVRDIVEDSVIEMLLEDRYLNDNDYVDNFARSLLTFSSPKSLIQLRKFTFKKGFTPDMWDLLVSKLGSDYEYRSAKVLAKSYMSKLPISLENDIKKQRLLRYLSQKGFPSYLVYSVVDNILGVK